jgi:hypothetical protein
MNTTVLIVVAAVLGYLLGLLLLIKGEKLRERLAFIDDYHIPMPILEKFRGHYPDLTDKQVQEVIEALKVYFRCCVQTNEFVAMPSKVVDMLWHEFILNTREYEQFCRQAFGKLLHHTPTEMLSSSKQIATTKMQKGMKVIWLFSCWEQKIQSSTPEMLPLLFAIDEALNIPDGFYYDLKKSGENWGVKEADGGYDGFGCGGGCGGCGGCGG